MVMTNKKIKWAYQKWCEGFSVREISDALDVDMATVYKTFKKRGLVRIRIPLKYEEENDDD